MKFSKIYFTPVSLTLPYGMFLGRREIQTLIPALHFDVHRGGILAQCGGKLQELYQVASSFGDPGRLGVPTDSCTAFSGAG